MRISRCALSILLLASLGFDGAAVARNVTIVHPIGDALASTAGRDMVSDLYFQFGSASASAGIVSTADVEVEGLGRATYNGNRRPTDAQVCDRALLDAISKLVLAARRVSADGVVGIISNYEGRAFDDPKNVECHAGSFSSHVVLKAKLVRLDAEPATPTAVPLEHAYAMPPVSGFADVNDAGAVPLSAEGQARYRYYLTLSPPKAFAVYEDGAWRFNWHDAQAMAKTLDYCARQGKRCWLYAVDDRVVWTTNPATRVSDSHQLKPR